MANSEKAKRRQAAGAGYDPTQIAMSGNSAAGAPGGVYPVNPMNTLTSMPSPGSMSGINPTPHGTDGLPVGDGRFGTVGAAPTTGLPQGLADPQTGMGGQQMRGQNAIPGVGFGHPGLAAPNNAEAGQIKMMTEAQSAMMAYAKLSPQNPEPPFPVNAMGMGSVPLDAVIRGEMPGSISPMMQYQEPGSGSLGLSGVPDSQIGQGPGEMRIAQSGTNTKRGGGRNQTA